MSSFAYDGVYFGSKHWMETGGVSAPVAPTITAPADASTQNRGLNVIVSATSVDSDLDRIDWVLNPGGSEVVVATDASAPYSSTWLATQAAGAHTLVARAVRGALSTDSAPIDVILDNWWEDIPGFGSSLKAVWVSGLHDLGSGGVSQVHDQSGNGSHATQGTPSQQPAFDGTAINGQPALAYSSAASMIMYANGAASAASGNDQPHNVYYIARYRGSPAAQAVIAFTNTADADSSHSYRRDATNFNRSARTADDAGSVSVATTQTIDTVNGHQWTWRFAGTTITCRVDQTDTSLNGTAQNVNTLTSNRCTLGGRKLAGSAETDFWEGDLGVATVHNVNLSATDRDTLEALLSALWGTP